MLILLHDVGRVDLQALVVAALHDSGDPELRVTSEAARGRLENAHVDAVELIPKPGDERLLERLVGLDAPAGLAATAERLDQLRHLHLRTEARASWSAIHAEVLEVWQPFAIRCHPRLATRYAHWARVFKNRIRRSEA